jgi:hypothetical protein
MANTHIQILRSYANTAPETLLDGELAYSFVSQTLFIGNVSNNVVGIAGPGYLANSISTIDGGSFS